MKSCLYIEELHNKRNFEIVSALCTDDCIVHVGRDEMKLEEYLHMLKSYSTSFSQHNTIIDDYFAEDNKVALR